MRRQDHDGNEYSAASMAFLTRDIRILYAPRPQLIALASYLDIGLLPRDHRALGSEPQTTVHRRDQIRLVLEVRSVCEVRR